VARAVRAMMFSSIIASTSPHRPFVMKASGLMTLRSQKTPIARPAASVAPTSRQRAKSPSAITLAA